MPFRADLCRAEVAEVLVDPVRHQPADRRGRSHHGCCRMSATHASEMFQSSIMSWSSKIIAVGTTEKNQRSIVRRPRLVVQPGVLLEVVDELGWREAVGSGCRRRDDRRSAPGPAVTSRRRRPDRRGTRRGRGHSSGGRIEHRSACARSASTPRPRSRARARSDHGGSCGAAVRHEPNRTRLGRSSPSVRITLGGSGLSGRATAPRRRGAPRTRRRGRLEALDDHERVVVAGDGERRR